jgi:hypothetical protein
MLPPILRRFSLLLAGAFFFCLTSAADATSITYNFEQFAELTSTPILNASPDIGPASFQASFTSTPNANSFSVFNFQPNQLFSGNSLANLAGFTGQTLTITLNMPVTSVSLSFGIIEPGTLFFNSLSGSSSMAATPQTGFPGGIFTFSSATPFNLFTLTADGPEFAIGNLLMNTANGTSVPELSSTFLLLTLAALPVLGLSRLRRNQLS